MLTSAQSLDGAARPRAAEGAGSNQPPLRLAHDIPSLDGIRAVAVFIVLLAHTGLEKFIPGGLGVTAFFFLSGYLITTLLVEEQRKHGHISIGKFYARRFFRLSPPLFITLLLAYALVLAGRMPGGATAEGFAAQSLYFANYYSIFFDTSMTIPKGTTVLWSLAVEEHFYIVYPLLVSVLLRHFSTGRIAAFLVLVCGVVLAWRYQLNVVHGAPAERTYYATDTRIDSIVFGCILALWKNPAMALASAARRPGRLEMSLLLAGVGLLLVSLLYREPAFRETLRYTLQGIAFLPLFYCAVKYHHLKVFSFLGSRLFRTLGVYSYSIYLIHHVAIFFLKQNFPTFDSIVFLLVAATLIAVAYAAVLDRYVEPHFRRLRAKFR